MKRNLTFLLMVMLALAWTAPAEQITINLNFNATTLTAGNYLWFNSNMNPPNTITATDPITLGVTTSVIKIYNGSTLLYTLNAPDNTITLSQNTTDSVTGTWTTTAWAGNVNPPNFFLDGYAWQIPTNLPGALDVVWTMDIATSVGDTGYTYQYQGAAAQYLGSTNFDMANAAVTAVAGQTVGTKTYSNAGTPSLYAINTNVIGGGTGGGSSNFTGSYSSTGSVTINGLIPPPDPPIVPEPTSVTLITLGAALIAGAQWVVVRKRRA